MTQTAEPPTVSDPHAGKGIVLYDGLCPLCLRSVAILKKLDWFGRLHWLNRSNGNDWLYWSSRQRRQSRSSSVM